VLLGNLAEEKPVREEKLLLCWISHAGAFLVLMRLPWEEICNKGIESCAGSSGFFDAM